MRRGLAIALSALLIATIPTVLIGNALWVLVNPWFVHVQYAIPGFPDDERGLEGDERSDLAVTGIRSVRPWDEGIVLLEEARLPDGEPAFEERETTHMQDVRDLIGGFLAAWAIALVAGIAAGAALWRFGEPSRLERALLWGAGLTIGVMALLGLLLLVSFDAFFDGFHGIFFEGDSWRFNEGYTVRRLYPYFFWGTAGAITALLVGLQAAAVYAGARRLGRPGASEAAASLER
jgi:integral membrane protein (TIGR01906 family)